MDMSTPMRSKPLVTATCKLGKNGCFDDGKCHALGNCENKIVTNANRIRAMSNEQLAGVFVKTVADGCPPTMDWDCTKDECGWDACNDCWCKWLQQPMKEETE